MCGSPSVNERLLVVSTPMHKKITPNCLLGRSLSTVAVYIGPVPAMIDLRSLRFDEVMY